MDRATGRWGPRRGPGRNCRNPPAAPAPPDEPFSWAADAMQDKHLRRKQKNREAAATSRKRQQNQRKQLEEENARLAEENAYLKKLLAAHLKGDKGAKPLDADTGATGEGGEGTLVGDPIEMLTWA